MLSMLTNTKSTMRGHICAAISKDFNNLSVQNPVNQVASNDGHSSQEMSFMEPMQLRILVAIGMMASASGLTGMGLVPKKKSKPY